jgi:protein-tyrosine phosphatase
MSQPDTARNKDLQNASQCIRVLFICMGNICRSPSAEAVFKHYVAQAGLQDVIYSDSAGTHDYHIGEPPDARARAAAQRRGYDLESLRARHMSARDFATFDLVLAMDEHNLNALQRDCPPEHRHKLRLFLEFGSKLDVREVPDPYYGGPQGFESVLDLVEDAAQGLLRHIRTQLLD